jgi:hypothetical protein
LAIVFRLRGVIAEPCDRAFAIFSSDDVDDEAEEADNPLGRARFLPE